ncbi:MULTISPECIES: phage tail protein [Leptolyngbya]|uniref:Phage tail protein n=1 Tax=Leptolyngbya boryana CZ1 TaxID=3060204 RepID=A0AA96WSM4_LEPBY|nr:MULTISPECIES: phage tail protein [Leptolyngbya]MBD1859851.1 phage tail protein [Leptolyngbya sp. FACHB-1624]MBN8562717.1 phage tail protein [Leptolyngbya sp. UWPOB_LEPTO1]MCY6490787.1 phage tail protein [Leptolyngbya sp. GGD]WNZ43444.1 phage tail protein [Leptolyngbya boryana CZ1]
MAIVTVENFELKLDKFDALKFKSVDVPAYKTDIQGGDALMSGDKGAVRQTFTKKREAAVQITVKTIASGNAKSTSSLMRKWLKECMPKSENGDGFPDAARTTGTIKTFNAAGEVIDSWKLSGVWVCKYTIGQLSIGGGLLEETYTLQVDQFDPA